MIDPYITCDKCEGSGYQHLFGQFYRWPCRGCRGTGERQRAIVRAWRLLRHGLASREDY